MTMAQLSKSIYLLVVLAICLVFYLAGPFAATPSPDYKSQTNAEARLMRWLEALAPPAGVFRHTSAYDPPARTPVYDKVKPLIPFSPFPLGKPESKHQRRLAHEATAEFSDASYSFQANLYTRLPRTDLSRLKTFRPHNLHQEELKPTFATFLSTRNASLQDPYFAAAQSLVYRMLWDPATASKDYPFTVFVAPFVAQQQRDVLAGAGANVHELELVEWQPTVEGVPARLRDSFTKLNMWGLIEFPSIAYLDLDAFPIRKIDEVFEIAEPQTCVSARLSEKELKVKDDICGYVFAGVENIGSSKGINGGFMIFQPNGAMHHRLLENTVRKDHYDNRAADQGFINWQFARNGPFPARVLSRRYNAVYPQASEEGELSIIHTRLWSQSTEAVPWLANNWNVTWNTMIEFYDSKAFALARELDGVDRAKKNPGARRPPPPVVRGKPAPRSETHARLRADAIDEEPVPPQKRAAPEDGIASNGREIPAGPLKVAKARKVPADPPLVAKGRNTAEDPKPPPAAAGARKVVADRPAVAAKPGNHGLSKKQQEMLERHQNGKLAMDFSP